MTSDELLEEMFMRVQPCQITKKFRPQVMELVRDGKVRVVAEEPFFIIVEAV